MGATVLVVGEQLDGVLSDTTYELAALARQLADGGSVIVAGGGPGFESGAGTIAADTVCVLDGAQMADYLPEAYAAAISALAADRGAELVLAATSAVGLDTAAAVAASLGAPLVSYVVGATREGGALVTTSQLYGGKLLAESEVDGGRVVLTVVPGSTSGEAGRGSAGAVENVAAAAAPGRMSFRRMIRPEAGGVDITKEEILVSVGRGIESQENIEMVEELATAIGGTVSASRPIIDSGWLPKVRQVGKSGVTVKPKLYLAVGISGAPEHLQGMKDAELIIAINTDANAPIFDVADYGICGDLFDVVPALTECATANA
ncbi:MAG TPA: electron transfer flavoprotein subunit alpha/FixB family protein [Candidatus Dormibacteraeota bacterium]|jgi:electron transfer flavoprotein alpha subunit|nr:electron transfer flavoprotein subunit alpha/FixB family protein [Candidatus Dormibacteraeota bacterium]